MQTSLSPRIGRFVRMLLVSAAFLGCVDSSTIPLDTSSEHTAHDVEDITARIRYDRDADVLQVATDGDVEQIFMQYRRGHRQDMSCDDLGQMATLTRGEDGVWRGGEAPSELLSPFYDERWERGEVTEEMIAQARQGTDALIELCITGDFGVLPVQVSLFGAMDTPAEAVLPDAEQMLMGYGLTRIGGKIAGKQRYAEACVEELGDIPFFADLGGGKYGTYDCRDGVEIPVRVTPKTGTDSQGQPVFGATTIAAVKPSTCDEPQHLDYYAAASSSSHGYGCEVGARVSHAQNSRGTDWVLLCRDVVDATAGKYNDIAMIGHNPSTGKTCFIQNALSSKTDGTAVAHPADVDSWDDTWRQGVDGGSCIRCHDSDPFIHTPWIDRAGVVPRRGSADAPYSVVNAVSQELTMPMHLTEPDTQACASCHRVGAWQSLRWTSLIEGLDTTFGKLETDYAKQPEQTYWMPPGSTYSSHAQWKAGAFSDAVDAIDDCIDDPSSCSYDYVPTGKLRIRLTTSTDHCALGLSSGGDVHVLPDQTMPDSWTWMSPDVTSLLTPLDAPFQCGQDGVEVEVVYHKPGDGVRIRTENAAGDTCYLITEDEGYGYTPVFGAPVGLKWNCGLAYGSAFDVAHVGDQVRLQARGPVGSCGVIVPSPSGSSSEAYVDCYAPGTPLYFEAETEQNWRQETVDRGDTNLYGPFKAVPMQEVVAEITPDGAGDADLMVWWGDAAQPTSVACHPYSSTSQERCPLTVPAQETSFRVSVKGYTDAGYNLKVTYAEPD